VVLHALSDGAFERLSRRDSFHCSVYVAAAAAAVAAAPIVVFRASSTLMRVVSSSLLEEEEDDDDGISNCIRLHQQMSMMIIINFFSFDWRRGALWRVGALYSQYLTLFIRFSPSPSTGVLCVCVSERESCLSPNENFASISTTCGLLRYAPTCGELREKKKMVWRVLTGSFAHRVYNSTVGELYMCVSVSE